MKATEVKKATKKDKGKLREEVRSLKKALNDYKLERRANWKSFRNKMNDDISQLKKLSK